MCNFKPLSLGLIMMIQKIPSMNRSHRYTIFLIDPENLLLHKILSTLINLLMLNNVDIFIFESEIKIINLK